MSKVELPLPVANRLLECVARPSSLPRVEEGATSYTVLIVDDSELIRRSLRSLVEQNTDWRVCGEAENGKVAVEQVKKLHPDIVTLDLQMPVMDGLEAARQITLFAPGTAMVMFTMHTSAQLLRDAQAAGIKDVIPKSDGLAEDLLASLRKVCAVAEKSRGL
jgi:DNA-binding NarL/FixJ family response regulator